MMHRTARLTTTKSILTPKHTPNIYSTYPYSSATNKNESTAQPQPLIELREYSLHPHKTIPYMKLTTDSADLRKSLVPLRLFTLPDTGGQINVATHFYYYEGGHAARDAARAAMAQKEEWRDYLKEARPCMQSQKSTLFAEAPLVSRMENVPGFTIGQAESSLISSSSANNNTVYEIRRYKLKLGYDTVPQFLHLYETGLPSKLTAAGTDAQTNLISLLYTEVGMLNEVIEIWRHGNGTGGMERSRVAARGALEWREVIGKIADLSVEFTTCIHRPADFSPLR